MPRALLARATIAAALVSACNVSACLAGRTLNARYADEVLWTVAQYQAGSVWACLVIVNALIWLCVGHAALRRDRGARLGRRAAGALLLSVPLGLELGMGVYYRRATGELSVSEALFTRASIALPPGDEQCIPMDLSDPFAWRFGEQRLRPKLLPLALDEAQLRAALAPLDCQRAP
jgi:hypothetical protein